MARTFTEEDDHCKNMKFLSEDVFCYARNYFIVDLPLFFVSVVVAVDFIGGFDYNSAHQPPTKSSRMQMQPL